ncbi:hypothetical protein MBCUT_07420 [Methanobrevibacter cuticularis]|uniref:DUF788 domain-containing protein n=1 Tax=Methanobrevibacter cuticularis TaxID=47311 RepID=A0A166EFE3_9EURY|nr:DUF788 domain-containing protein [Methanobrevibacter cuticularis]KZX16588.1 hypothetical protein MBCUT_07420 [Methanobrevibacter cuticularis]
MNGMMISSYLSLIISSILIIFALIFNPAVWIVYGIAIVFIPLFILSLGLITMAKSNKEEQEERKEEPFIGY